MTKTPEELFQERNKRVEDAIQLKQPDRVPSSLFFTFFPAKYAGISCEEAMYNYDKLAEVSQKAIVDFDLDAYMNPFGIVAVGPLMEILGDRRFKWPGHGVSSHSTYQFVEGEHMKAEEYDEFIADTTDFMIRKYLPRALGALEPLRLMPYIPGQYYLRLLTSTAVFGMPEVVKALESLMKAGAEALKVLSKAAAFTKNMTDLGFPSQFGSVAYAPFDYIGDFYRGTKGIMLDMYRQPGKLLEAMEKITPAIVQASVDSSKRTGINRAFIPLHKGLDGFMSLEQFQTFFWPTLKKTMLALIDNGIVPCTLWEGDCTSRLEIIKDIPAGKAVYWFERTDIFKAKQILGDRICIRGNVPAPLLCTGTPQQVKDYCKKLIEVVGKGGGFIMDGAIGIPDEAKLENVKAIVDSIREYGVY